MSSVSSDMILQVSDFRLAAGDRLLLEGFALELRAAEFVALIGPSGSGKSTLLRAIAGLQDPVAGEIRFEGRAPEALGWPAYRRRVVLVDQRPVLFDQSVRSNLQRPFAYRSAQGAHFSREAASGLLAAFGLGAERLEQEARSLSEGERQRVCLVRALLVGPRILLLDEPTSALDPEAVERVEAALVREAKRRGMAAVVVTHDRAQAERLCDRRIDLAAFVPPTAAQGGRHAE